MKPITSPDKGSMPAGPCRAGVAVIRNVAPSGLLIFVLCHGANPSAGVPRPLCTSVRREQARRGHSVSFAGTIEIVSMLVVAQEYRVDLSDLICRRRRSGELFQRDMRQLVFTWSIKCRISEQVETVRFDECSGTANQSDDWCTHDHSR